MKKLPSSKRAVEVVPLIRQLLNWTGQSTYSKQTEHLFSTVGKTSNFYSMMIAVVGKPEEPISLS